MEREASPTEDIIEEAVIDSLTFSGCSIRCVSPKRIPVFSFFTKIVHEASA